MPRFSLSQLLMGIPLVALVMALTQAEGCGRRFTNVGRMSFSPDGKQLLVLRWDARDARVPFKAYEANISRKIILLDTSDGSVAAPLHQLFLPGIQGPRWSWMCSTGAVAKLLADDKLLMAAPEHDGYFQVHSIAAFDPQAVQTPGAFLARYGLSRDRSFLVVHDEEMKGLHFIDLKRGQVAQHTAVNHVEVGPTPLPAISPDNARVAFSTGYAVDIWEVGSNTAAQLRPLLRSDTPIHALEWGTDASLIVATRDGLQQYDLSGELVGQFSSLPSYQVAVSSDGALVAASSGEQVQVFDVASTRLLRQFPAHFATAIEFQPGSSRLAIGDTRGKVTLVDALTGERIWTTTAPGRYRYPWTIPAALLVVWLGIVLVLAWRRRARRSKPAAAGRALLQGENGHQVEQGVQVNAGSEAATPQEDAGKN